MIGYHQSDAVQAFMEGNRSCVVRCVCVLAICRSTLIRSPLKRTFIKGIAHYFALGRAFDGGSPEGIDQYII